MFYYIFTRLFSLMVSVERLQAASPPFDSLLEQKCNRLDCARCRRVYLRAFKKNFKCLSGLPDAFFQVRQRK